ncbi:MAG: glycosyltransferase [Phycisphaerae bacterium]|nr:glycosyltransferase [Phycisphaerae bacterium]MDW8260901.1 glycosyltransferase [Phycisphaerales bacterium]
MATPRVSVILPVYNGQEYLAEAVESILHQSFDAFELIIVDDGSTDRSPAILRRYAAHDPRIHLISRPNTGLVGALRDGLAAARSDLIARMDADDIALPQRLEKQYHYMVAHPECVLLGTFVRAIDPHGLLLWDETSGPVTHEEIDRELMKGRGGVIRHPAAMMRLEAVRRVGGYRDHYNTAEDLDLFLRLAEIGRIANLPEILLLYRQHYKSVNRTRFALQNERITQVVHEAARRRGVTIPADWRYTPKPPRPADQQLRDWGWLALKQNRADIARKHARSLLGMQPTRLDSWRLLFCALRGY